MYIQGSLNVWPQEILLNMVLSKEEAIDFFFWAIPKKKVHLMKITNATHLIERMSARAKIDGNVIASSLCESCKAYQPFYHKW